MAATVPFGEHPHLPHTERAGLPDSNRPYLAVISKMCCLRTFPSAFARCAADGTRRPARMHAGSCVVLQLRPGYATTGRERRHPAMRSRPRVPPGHEHVRGSSRCMAGFVQSGSRPVSCRRMPGGASWDYGRPMLSRNEADPAAAATVRRGWPGSRQLIAVTSMGREHGAGRMRLGRITIPPACWTTLRHVGCSRSANGGRLAVIHAHPAPRPHQRRLARQPAILRARRRVESRAVGQIRCLVTQVAIEWLVFVLVRPHT
jgi:hypothetical protein